MGESESYLRFEKDTNGSPARLNLRKLRRLLDYCLDNAQQLLKSAEFLFNKKLYSVSFLLSVLAMEELGKRRILERYIWVSDNDDERHKFWHSFRSHKDKLYWALRHLINIDTNQNKEVDYVSIWLKEHQELESAAIDIDWFKQLVTYTNVIEGEVISPIMIAKRRDASKWLGISKECLDYHSKMRPTDRIIEYHKAATKERKKGESLVDFIGRLYLSDKARKDEELPK